MTSDREHEIKECIAHLNAMVQYCYKNNIEVTIVLKTSSVPIELNFSPVQKVELYSIIYK